MRVFSIHFLLRSSIFKTRVDRVVSGGGSGRLRLQV